VSEAETGQVEWEVHSRDEERAIRRQQTAAGPSHEPVGDSIPDRVQASADSATELERQRCAAAVDLWFEPSILIAMTGPLAGESIRAVHDVLRAIREEIGEKA
jgi:phage-related minor tail protein